MLRRLVWASIAMMLNGIPANAEPLGFMVGCTVDSVNASHAYSARASMIRDPNLVYVMVPIANQGAGGLTLIAVFNGVNAGNGDQYQVSAQLEAGFVFTLVEPEPAYNTATTLRGTEISVPLDFSSFSYLERMWRCVDGSCSIETLTFSASCSDARPL